MEGEGGGGREREREREGGVGERVMYCICFLFIFSPFTHIYFSPLPILSFLVPLGVHPAYCVLCR